MTLKDKVAELCRQQGITIRELERRAGLSERTIQHWDKSEPSGAKLYAVANALNVPIEELLSVYHPELESISYLESLRQDELFQELQSLRDDEDFRNLLYGYKNLSPEKVRIMKRFMKSLIEDDENAD